MKSFVFTTLALCVVVTAGILVYPHQQPAPASSAPIVDSAPAAPPPKTIVVLKPAQPKTVAAVSSASVPLPITNALPAESAPDEAATALSRDVDMLASTNTSYSDRQALLKKLKDSGELNQAIAELQQRAAANPNDAETLVALGEASLKKFPMPDYDQSGILALQVDQAFSAALKIDPSDWEAQYFKADSLSHWPAEMNKGPQVIQQLSTLIDQQETMTPQPQFAQSYVLLGDQYQKAGQSDYAVATWKLGLAQFPTDPALQQRTAGQ